MSIYDKYSDNNITLRSNEILSKSIKKWNNLTQSFEEITGGGGGGSDLPSYLRPEEINFNDRILINDERIRMGSGSSINFNNVNLDENLLISYENSIEEIDNKVKEHSNDIIDLDQLITTTKSDVDKLNEKIFINSNYLHFIHKTDLLYNHLRIAAGGVYQWSNTNYLPNQATPASANSFTNSGINVNGSLINSSMAILLSSLRTHLTSSVTNINFNKPFSIQGLNNVTATNEKILIVDPTTNMIKTMNIPSTPVFDPILDYQYRIMNNNFAILNGSGTSSTYPQYIADNTYTFSINTVTKNFSYKFKNDRYTVIDFRDRPISIRNSYTTSKSYILINDQSSPSSTDLIVTYADYKSSADDITTGSVGFSLSFNIVSMKVTGAAGAVSLPALEIILNSTGPQPVTVQLKGRIIIKVDDASRQVTETGTNW